MTLLRDILTSRRQLAILRRHVNRLAAERDAARADLQRARDQIERMRLDRVQVGLRAGFDVGALSESLHEANNEIARLKAALDTERFPPPPTRRRNCWTCENNGEDETCAIVCADEHPATMDVLRWIRENISSGRDMPATTADGCPGYEETP